MSNQENLRRCSLASLWIIILLLGLAGCSTTIESLQPQRTEEFYIPPTAAGGTSHQTILTPTTITVNKTLTPDIRPSPTPQCSDDLLFIDDLTIPDGTVVNSGEILDKHWQVENSGSCNWDMRYRMKLVAGAGLGASPEQALYPARSGTQALLRILFTAPAEPGTYHSAWQAFTPQGDPFGETFYVEITVDNQ